MQQNIGRDISKFFYGGYSMEDNLGPKPGQGYRHSNYARLIVNSIAIATYEVELECPITKVKLEQKLTYPVLQSSIGDFQLQILLPRNISHRKIL